MQTNAAKFGEFAVEFESLSAIFHGADADVSALLVNEFAIANNRRFKHIKHWMFGRPKFGIVDCKNLCGFVARQIGLGMRHFRAVAN